MTTPRFGAIGCYSFNMVRLAPGSIASRPEYRSKPNTTNLYIEAKRRQELEIYTC